MEDLEDLSDDDDDCQIIEQGSNGPSFFIFLLNGSLYVEFFFKKTPVKNEN